MGFTVKRIVFAGDPTLARKGVADATANLEKLRALADQAATDQRRNRELATSGLVAKSAFEQGASALRVALAEVRSAEIALQRAKQDLDGQRRGLHRRRRAGEPGRGAAVPVTAVRGRELSRSAADVRASGHQTPQ